MPAAHYVQSIILGALGLVLRLLPRGMVAVAGKLFGRVMMLQRRRRRITESNVYHAFPESSKEWQGAVVHGSYENLGITLAELLVVPSLTSHSLMRLVSLSGLEEVKARAENGKGSILVSGHFGNWEYMAMAAGVHLGVPLTIVTHPQRNERVNETLNSYRAKFGNILVPMHDAARTLIRTVRNGGVAAFLVDQHAVPERDPWITFFGRTTPTYAAPAALALRLGVPMYFGVAIRHDDGTYHVNVQPVPMDGLDASEASVVELTRRHVMMLENAIREHPHLWSWQHRRWREPQPPSTAHDVNRNAQTTQTSS